MLICVLPEGPLSRAHRSAIARVDVRVVAVLQGERRIVSLFGRDIWCYRKRGHGRLVKEFGQALPSLRSMDRITSFVKTRAGVPVAVTGSAVSGSAIWGRDRAPRALVEQLPPP